MLTYISKPYIQATIFIGVTLVLLLIVRPKQEETLWILAGTLYILFMVANGVMLFWQEAHWPYFFLSLLISILYLFIAQAIVTVHVRLFNTPGSGESSMIFLVVIYHPIVLLGVIFLKWMYRLLF